MLLTLSRSPDHPHPALRVEPPYGLGFHRHLGAHSALHEYQPRVGDEAPDIGTGRDVDIRRVAGVDHYQIAELDQAGVLLPRSYLALSSRQNSV